MAADVRATLTAALDDARQRRHGPGEALAGDAEAIARACHDLAHRFHAGGRLIAFGNGAPASDAAHVSVEFVHPVVVGKRALPAMSLATDVATVTGIANTAGFTEIFAAQLRTLAAPDDMAIGFSADGHCANVGRGLEVAADLGLLTVAVLGGDGGQIAANPAVDHVLVARSDDPLVVKELHVTIYHVLWELVHVFFEQPGVLAPRKVS